MVVFDTVTSRREVFRRAGLLLPSLFFGAHTALGQYPATLNRPIPRTGEPLPVVGLGTAINFDAAGDTAKQAQLAAVVDALVAGGCKPVDTARPGARCYVAAVHQACRRLLLAGGMMLPAASVVVLLMAVSACSATDQCGQPVGGYGDACSPAAQPTRVAPAEPTALPPGEPVIEVPPPASDTWEVTIIAMDQTSS